MIRIPSIPRANWSINDFEILHKLGSGHYGEVYLAAIKEYNYVVAIKQMKISRLIKYNTINQLRREVEIAFNTRHKYLLRTYTYFYDKEFIYLVIEPCSKGMLYSLLNKVKFFTPELAAQYTAQLAEALYYLHTHHILHRDIKPENILLDHNGNIKLADFGWSVHDPQLRRRTACGTPEYFPPEIVTKSEYNTSVDLWCLGVFCYELMLGRTPFVQPGEKDPKQQDICERIKETKWTLPDTLPSEARDLISKLLVKDPSNRISLDAVITHPFLVNYYYKRLHISIPRMKQNRSVPLKDNNNSFIKRILDSLPFKSPYKEVKSTQSKENQLSQSIRSHESISYI